MMGAVGWGGARCLPSGTVASLQHRKSRANSHSAGEPGAARFPQTQPIGTRSWGQSPCSLGKAAGPLPKLSCCPCLRGHPRGCQALGAQCTEGPAGALPGTAATKPPFFPQQLPRQPRHGGTWAPRPHAGMGTHMCPHCRPWRMRGRFRRHSRHSHKQDGRGPHGLTSPLRPMSPSTALRRSHELMAQECTRGCASKQPPPHARPGRSLPRRGAGGGHGALCLANHLPPWAPPGAMGGACCMP